MPKSSGLGALLTGIALGAAALFLSDEKNRAKVQSKLGKVSEDTKDLGRDWQLDPDKAIDQLKKKAAAITKELEKSSKDAGKKLSAVSREKMVDALAETEKMIKHAREALAAEKK